MKRVSLLATAALAIASSPAVALGGLVAPRRPAPPKPFTPADAERLAKAEAKRQRKAAKLKGGAK